MPTESPPISDLDLPILVSTATPSATKRSNDPKRKTNMRKVMSFDPAHQPPSKVSTRRAGGGGAMSSSLKNHNDMDASTSTLGDESSHHSETLEAKFMRGLDESLLDQYETSDDSSSYWSSSDDDDSDDDSDDDRGSHGDISGDEGFTDTDDEKAIDESPTKGPKRKAKRSDSTLSLDALLKVQMQLGDAKKPPPKDKEVRRRGRRLNKDHNATSLGALARKVGSDSGNEMKEVVSTFRRSESSNAIPFKSKPRKFLHIQQEGSIQGQQAPPLVGMADQSSRTVPAKNATPTRTAMNKRASKYGEHAVANIKPRDHYMDILKTAGVAAPLVRYDDLMDFFAPVTEKDKAAFDMALVGAVRDKNLAKLQDLHASGHPMQARSQFGESLVHICARRGTPEMLRFLLAQKGDDRNDPVTCRVCCDYGRTPLHDAAWSTDAVSLEMMKILINECPDLLLVLDKRGFMPLDYIPRERWPQCCAFLDKHKDMLMPTGVLFGESSESESSDEEGESGEEESEGEESD